MPTALTGSLGWTGLHPLQLGGPPLISNFDQALPLDANGEPAEALPLIAHVYQADGVTSLGTLSVLGRPAIKTTLANGGQEQITLEVATRSPEPIYGQVVYGAPLYGAQVVQGNVIRLSEQGGDGRLIYGGIVESLPDVASPSGSVHQIVLTPFAMELGRAYVQVNYETPTDVAQMARDAFAATLYCHCDQVSVPPTTGITGMGDFRNRPAQELLDTARAIAGYQWFWHVDQAGRGWFQPMGSAAAHTLRMGTDYEERTSNGGDISDQKNKVVAVGGVTTAGLNAVAIYDGPSQDAIGIRALNPPLEIPGISDQPTLQLIATNVGLALDRPWTRVSLKALPAVGQRIHGSRPGGGMLRYWEPAARAIPQSGRGSGGYTGPFIGQSVTYDGLYQVVEAGDVPVTDQRDIDALVASLVSRSAALSVVVTAASLNRPGQVVTGTWQSGTGTTNPSGVTVPAALWSLDQQVFQAIDQSGQPRVQMGNLAALGGSTAGWKFRGIDATGSPVFDSDQVFGDRVMKNLGIATAGSHSFSSTTFAQITGATLAFSVARTCNLYAPFLATGRVQTNNGNVGFVRAILDGVTTSGNQNFGVLANFAQTSAGWIFVTGLAAGSYTLRLEAAVNATPQTFDCIESAVQAFQLGG